MNNLAPVLVTDAPSNASLAVVRSLGRRGIPVGVCGFADEFNLAAYSRFATECFTLPSPTREPSAFVEALCALLERGKYPILFPTTERTIQLIAAARDRLPGWVRIPIPDSDALETALDKGRTAALAERLNVSMPRTWCPADAGEVAALAGELPSPVIVKPRRTNFLGAEGRLLKTNHVVVKHREDLVAAWQTVDHTIPQPVIQEVVRGRGIGVNTLWKAGSAIVWFCHRRLREIDLSGGRSTAAASMPCDFRLVASAYRMLAALAWHGVAMVEFKWDEERDDFWLLEINGRFWGSLPLALASGVDFPYYLYQLAVDELPMPPATYPTGVMARDAVAEMKHFVKVMKGGAGVRGATLRQAATILHPWKASFNWVPDDPEPGRREWVHELKRVIGRGVRAA